jgi:hypothetical protein
MDQSDEAWVSAVSKLQDRIAKRLSEVGFHDDKSFGTITHHLAEVSYLGGKLSEIDVPAFLNLNVENRDALGDVVAEMVNDLDEMKEAIVEMEKAMVQLMNFLTQ